jgi:WD40 repeat protein
LPPDPVELPRCADCGTELPGEGAISGLCPQCLLSLALQDSDRVRDPDESPTLDGRGPGRILGERYQMRELLGRGGMGEVWRAFDLKLRVDVALKAIRAARGESERARDMLRQEVRSARAVVSPNVCRIFDLVVEDGRELVSMEFIDGTTLADTLRVRGPLPLREAREIASQFLSGLEAIHQAGLVHRDFKPENVMLTRAGRVVVMDFGLARGPAEVGTGTVSGTPAYMSPEQARGQSVDARADVFSAAVVLAEMLTVGGEGIRARQALWHSVRESPPQVLDGPWAPVLRQALDPQADRRHASARALAHALEEGTLRLPGFEEKRPYPGLASFSAEDAEYFFGREVEVEGIWKTLKRPRLLGLIGPSGAGKSSFLRAGLLPTLPRTWRAALSTPGTRPFQFLAQALAPSLAGDAQAVQSLLRFEDPEIAVPLVARWRERHEQAIIVVDQFEELFTLNPPEVKEAFARFLGRLVLEADVHVLLAMRDDFLFHCHAHEALAPILSDLTLLGPLSESGLRRALVQPALACGYRFEDEALVDEMVREVGRERGALPLLAFAASRLWEKRDRERGLLTREAYKEIGGVAGALAQHAEATLASIGTHRTPLVREVLRDLVTAQGTRAAREREELLSAFESTPRSRGEEAGSTASPSGVETPRWSRKDASEVLDALVDARLLTSYERPADEEGKSRRHVEIIHESLLRAWPRLVRWQAQDEDGALLRDQVRQAAQAWQDRGRPEDLLWSGTAYRDFALWRERYPGGLTATEQAFAEAAARRAGRRRRQRRLAVGAMVAVLALGLGVVGTFWRRAEASRRNAEAQTLRAEASKLLALGQLELEKFPTASVAYALKSLELADAKDARLLALRALQRGPTAVLAPARQEQGFEILTLGFSPSGEWLAAGGRIKAQVLHRDGRGSIGFDALPSGPGPVQVALAPDSDLLLAAKSGSVRASALPSGTEVWRARPDVGGGRLWIRGRTAVTAALGALTVSGQDVIRRWSLGDGTSQLVGSIPHRPGVSDDPALVDVDAGGQKLAHAMGPRLYVRSLEDWAAGSRLIGEHTAPVAAVSFHPGGRQLAASDLSGETRIWPTEGPRGRPRRVLRSEGTRALAFDNTGRWLAASGSPAERPTVRLWDLTAPLAVDPLVFHSDAGSLLDLAFDPGGRWLVTALGGQAAFWPLGGRYARVLSGSEESVGDAAMTPDGQSLVSLSNDGIVRAWSVSPEAEEAERILLRDASLTGGSFAIDRGSRRVAIPADGGAIVVPLAGGPPRRLAGSEGLMSSVAFSEDGRRVAAAPIFGRRAVKVVHIWDLDTGGVQVLGPAPGAGDGKAGGFQGLSFLDGDRLLAGTTEGLLLFDLRDGRAQVVTSKVSVLVDVSRARHLGVGFHEASASPGRYELVRFGLDGKDPTVLTSHGYVDAAALDPTGTLVASGSADGTIRVGPVTGGEPHYFFGHEGPALTVGFSPDGRWLVSAGSDKKIRMWPLPDASEPPFQTLPREELLAKLRALTNLRAVPDPSSATGYRIEAGPFPGWARVPAW